MQNDHTVGDAAHQIKIVCHHHGSQLQMLFSRSMRSASGRT
jgi:hypothetical protein